MTDPLYGERCLRLSAALQPKAPRVAGRVASQNHLELVIQLTHHHAVTMRPLLLPAAVKTPRRARSFWNVTEKQTCRLKPVGSERHRLRLRKLLPSLPVACRRLLTLVCGCESFPPCSKHVCVSIRPAASTDRQASVRSGLV